jgi:hypothetical protein
MTAAGQWLAVAHDGAEVRTADGLAAGEALHPVQQAFIDHDAFQCGYCTPGQICSAVGMLQEAKRGWPSHVTADLAGDPELTDAAARGGHPSAASQKPGERDGGGPAAAGSAAGHVSPLFTEPQIATVGAREQDLSPQRRFIRELFGLVADGTAVALVGRSAALQLPADLRWIPLAERVVVTVALVLPAAGQSATADRFEAVALAHATAHGWLN